jgi:hypothetical protein
VVPGKPCALPETERPLLEGVIVAVVGKLCNSSEPLLEFLNAGF